MDHELRTALVRMLLDADTTTDAGELTREFMRTFLLVGSHTPDNLNCARNIEYAAELPGNGLGDGRSRSGLTIKGTDVSLSDVAWEIESTPLPRESFPGLTVKQWEAATRLITVLVCALERETEPPASS
ncbi:hypothetical protein [Streptomyces poriticola]|uniref:hypothetical protein n=1 Tax=Streptomyces poriticola TaxID=3120506 RepID=UPI002FCE5DED